MTPRPTLLQLLQTGLWRIPSLFGAALAALFVGQLLGYFIVFYIEWGAILGGLAMAGAVFLFPCTGRWFQVWRIMLFIFGIALVGAGFSDLFNQPEPNQDVLPGFQIGFVFGLVLAGVIWGPRLGVAKADFMSGFPLKMPALSVIFDNTVAMGFCVVALYYLVPLYAATIEHLNKNDSPTELIEAGKALYQPDDASFVRLMMHDIYYWPARRNIAMAKNDTPATLMAKLAIDQWSTSESVERRDDWENGVILSRGIMLADQGSREKIFVTHVNHDSPAARSGVRRGDRLVLSGDEERAKNIKVRIKKPSGEIVPVLAKPEKHAVDTVIYRVLLQDSKRIGYLWLRNFSDKAISDTEKAFREFKRQGISEVILDLRYNGGGNFPIQLANFLAGARFDGKVFFKAMYSAKYRDWDKTYTFRKHRYALPIQHVYALTTEDTCSSSELIINGLRPYLPVTTIGQTTCGKPYGMLMIEYGKAVYSPVTYRIFNAFGKSDYDHGIKPDCVVNEDFSHPMGQPGDPLFDAALYYVRNNACPVR